MRPLRKQTAEQRKLIKEEIAQSGEYRQELDTILILDDTTKFKKKNGEVWTCREVQLKGALIDNGIHREYVSYRDLENSEIYN